MAQSEYLVIVEKFASGAFGAYVPELPGISVAGETEDEVRDLVGEAIRLYLDELDRGDESRVGVGRRQSLHGGGLTTDPCLLAGPRFLAKSGGVIQDCREAPVRHPAPPPAT